MKTYLIEKVLTPDNEITWTVVEYEGGICKGGDHHWYIEQIAKDAKVAYELGIYVHPDFDPDPTEIEFAYDFDRRNGIEHDET